MKPATLGLGAKHLHLLVEEAARIASRAAARADVAHARAVQRLVVRANRSQRQDAFLEAGLTGIADDGLEPDVIELVREILLTEKIEQRREALRRRLVEVTADRDVALAGDLPDVGDDAI